MESLRWMYIVLGALFVVLGLPLLQRRIKPNLWYGFRVRQTLDNPTVWYDINAYFARWMIGIGVLTVIAAFIVPNTDEDSYALIMAVLVGIVLLVSIMFSLRRIRALAA